MANHRDVFFLKTKINLQFKQPMAQLTGIFDGTPQADSFLGEILSGVVIGNELTGIAAIDLNINSIGGNDIVEIITDIDSRGNSLLTAKGVGVLDAIVKTGDGADVFTVNSTVFSASTSLSIGLGNSWVQTDADDDIIAIRSISRGVDPVRTPSTIGVGVQQVTIQSGQGADTIIIESSASTSSSSGGVANATGMENSLLLADQGKDYIGITVTSSSGGRNLGDSTSTGVWNSTIDGGDQADTIVISANASAGARSNPASRAVGIENSTVIKGGAGADEITIFVNVSGGSSPLGGPQLTGYGVLNSIVLGNDDNDVINITATQTVSPFGRGTVVGAANAIIDGGSGDDTITVQGVNFDIQDSVINGDSGNDTFDIGIGSGFINGGDGIDLIKLDFFDRNLMSIALLSRDCIEITGSNWTQIIYNMEEYDVAGIVYNATDVVSLLS